MEKKDYIKYVDEKLTGTAKNIMKNQIKTFFEVKDKQVKFKKYQIGEEVVLTKGTLLHGCETNFEGLKNIVKEGLLTSIFTNERMSKYPYCVGVWNIKKTMFLRDYINYYSGGTVEYRDYNRKVVKTEVIPYQYMANFISSINPNKHYMWRMEQTKEARFLPSYVQNKTQIGIIFNSNKYVKELVKNDVLNDKMSNIVVKQFINPEYYDKFIIDRKNKDDFFTNRENAILFGIPSNFIEGILVGRKYENNTAILNKIKKILPNAYICNLDGKVIRN